ncbi:porin family protein [Mucilaginibacter auburnensis]|uniref:Outer membrane protein with beta-barrel domain n=1 Tax=Mucilaginibacter auburnensis TaxID=1457233 RepID=A0A2H9VPS6_9SPHI|nr:porin family protein [Mucilaginibacter auburnensis]PJJ80325.1 outer membrane protein with beta-barrel domain [Mucilaginibacter auburnensis]
MKKYLLSAALLIAVSISAHAQFSLGVKGGVNFSKITTDNLNESTVAGYQAGLFGRIGTGVYVQPELYLSSKGGKFNSNNNGTNYSGDVKFTTLNVPLLVGTAIGDDDLNFRIMGGPIYSYIMDQSKNFSANFGGAYADFGNYNKSTLGFQVGAGVDIGSITADLRYEGGLTKLNENYGQRQNLWALSIGFKIF